MKTLPEIEPPHLWVSLSMFYYTYGKTIKQLFGNCVINCNSITIVVVVFQRDNY